MRYVVMALALLLAGCDSGANAGPAGGDGAKGEAASRPLSAATNGAVNYRYAYRLPGNRIEAVQEAHARGCDQLGPARCRIMAMRYAVGADNAIGAVLTLKLDPALARAFGKAATKVVMRARGTLTDAEVAGADSLAASERGDTVVSRLRDAQTDAEATLRSAGDDQRPQAASRLERIRTALAVVGEVDAGAGGAATVPVLFTYGSGGAMPGIGGSPDATFDTAGETFLASLAGLLVLLAGIGPWVVLLLGGALLLRWVLGRTEPAPAPVLPPAPRDESEAGRNVIQRWFSREHVPEHEPTD